MKKVIGKNFLKLLNTVSISISTISVSGPSTVLARRGTEYDCVYVCVCTRSVYVINEFYILSCLKPQTD